MNKALAGLTAAGKIPGFSKVSNGNKMGCHGIPREKPPKTRAELTSALDAHDRVMAVSTEIRKRAGLPPLVEREQVKQWRAALAGAPKAKRPRKVATGAHIELTPAQRVDALARRRRELEREREAVDAETRELVALAQGSSGLSVSSVARKLGLSRQRLYQLASA